MTPGTRVGYVVGVWSWNWHGRTPVLGVLTGNAEGRVVVLFEVSEPVSIMVGSRFSSGLGRGVVTRIVK